MKYYFILVIVVKSAIFTNNKVDIYFYDNERQYSQLITSNYSNRNLIVKILFLITIWKINFL